MGWTFSYQSARNKLESICRSKIKTEYVIADDTDAVATRKAIDDFIQRGFGMIVSTSFSYMDAMDTAAAAYPNTKFLAISMYKTRPNEATGF